MCQHLMILDSTISPTLQMVSAMMMLTSNTDLIINNTKNGNNTCTVNNTINSINENAKNDSTSMIFTLLHVVLLRRTYTASSSSLSDTGAPDFLAIAFAILRAFFFSFCSLLRSSSCNS